MQSPWLIFMFGEDVLLTGVGEIPNIGDKVTIDKEGYFVEGLERELEQISAMVIGTTVTITLKKVEKVD